MNHHDVETMRCTGSPACNVTTCDHYERHARYPDRLNPYTDYCGVGSCFGGAVCIPVEPPEPMPREDELLGNYEKENKKEVVK